MFLAGLLAAVVISAIVWWLGSGPAEIETDPGLGQSIGAAPVVSEVSTRSAGVVGAQSRGTRKPVQLPAAGAGIPMGDGSFVPPLNGVTVADGIPPVRRNRRLPPPGPIVAKIVDGSGQEWWEHADGSQTSCSFASVTDRHGVTRRIVSTQHGAATPRESWPARRGKAR